MSNKKRHAGKKKSRAEKAFGKKEKGQSPGSTAGKRGNSPWGTELENGINQDRT